MTINDTVDASMPEDPRDNGQHDVQEIRICALVQHATTDAAGTSMTGYAPETQGIRSNASMPHASIPSDSFAGDVPLQRHTACCTPASYLAHREKRPYFVQNSGFPWPQ